MTDIQPGYKQTEVGVIPEDWSIISAFDFLFPRAALCTAGADILHSHAACGNESKNLAVKVEAHLAKMGFNL